MVLVQKGWNNLVTSQFMGSITARLVIGQSDCPYNL